MLNGEPKTAITCASMRSTTEKAVPFDRLRTQKSTVLLSENNGRRLYEVFPTPTFKREYFLFGRSLPRSERFEIKEKAAVTGNRYDRGYILIERVASNVS